MAIHDEDAAHEKFMAVAPHVMVLANKIVEAYVPAEKQSIQQAEDLYRVIDAAIGRWAKQSGGRRGDQALVKGQGRRQWTSWFRLRLDGAGSIAKPTT